MFARYCLINCLRESSKRSHRNEVNQVPIISKGDALDLITNESLILHGFVVPRTCGEVRNTVQCLGGFQLIEVN